MKKAHPLEGPIVKGDSSERTDRKKHPVLQVNQLGKQNSWMSVTICHWLGALVQVTACVVVPAAPTKDLGHPPPGPAHASPSPCRREWEVLRMISLPV